MRAVLTALLLIFVLGCTTPQIIAPQAPPALGDTNIAGKAYITETEHTREAIANSAFAPPWDVWNNNRLVLEPTQQEYAQGENARVNIHHGEYGITYEDAYVLTAGTAQWRPLVVESAYSNAPRPFPGFIQDDAQLNIPEAYLAPGENYVAVYFCTEIVETQTDQGLIGQVACGCKEENISSCGHWNLQRVSVDDAPTPVCGNDICEVGETYLTCEEDCLDGPDAPEELFCEGVDGILVDNAQEQSNAELQLQAFARLSTNPFLREAVVRHEDASQLTGFQPLYAAPPDTIQSTYIVKFTESETAAQGGAAFVMPQTMQTLQQRFEQDMQGGMQNAFAQGAPAPQADIQTRVYEYALNGVIAELTHTQAARAASLDYVQAVTPDLPVQITLDTSTKTVDAQYAWEHNSQGEPCNGEDCLDGSGVVIAVLDTGVDYTHSWLGGCESPGPECKVIGGYDFIDEDTDPQDGHGHGTHVASTAAGSHNTFSGVAPGAEILAVRVLDDYGGGSYSGIIAGINYVIGCVVEQDPLCSDKRVIISMSLGGQAVYEDDPLVEVSRRAIAAGIPVIVAAGNSGSSNFESTVDSPGITPEAITVGASTAEADWVSSFSSRGVYIYDGQVIVKPEILAPGEEICAAVPDEHNMHGETCACGQGLSIDGTSMATPHVAGAAAILLEIDSSLNPQEIKEILVGTTNPQIASRHEKGLLNIKSALTKDIVSLHAPVATLFEERVSEQETVSVQLGVRNREDSPIHLTPYYFGQETPAGPETIIPDRDDGVVTVPMRIPLGIGLYAEKYYDQLTRHSDAAAVHTENFLGMSQSYTPEIVLEIIDAVVNDVAIIAFRSSLPNVFLHINDELPQGTKYFFDVISLTQGVQTLNLKLIQDNTVVREETVEVSYDAQPPQLLDATCSQEITLQFSEEPSTSLNVKKVLEETPGPVSDYYTNAIGFTYLGEQLALVFGDKKTEPVGLIDQTVFNYVNMQGEVVAQIPYEFIPYHPQITFEHEDTLYHVVSNRQWRGNGQNDFELVLLEVDLESLTITPYPIAGTKGSGDYYSVEIPIAHYVEEDSLYMIEISRTWNEETYTTETIYYERSYDLHSKSRLSSTLIDVDCPPETWYWPNILSYSSDKLVLGCGEEFFYGNSGYILQRTGDTFNQIFEAEDIKAARYVDGTLHVVHDNEDDDIPMYSVITDTDSQEIQLKENRHLFNFGNTHIEPRGEQTIITHTKYTLGRSFVPYRFVVNRNDGTVRHKSLLPDSRLMDTTTMLTLSDQQGNMLTLFTLDNCAKMFCFVDWDIYSIVERVSTATSEGVVYELDEQTESLPTGSTGVVDYDIVDAHGNRLVGRYVCEQD